MEKNVKSALVIVGIAALAFLLMSFSTKKGQVVTPLSEEEKLKLFEEANSYYRGGAAPSDEILANYEKTRTEALAKLKQLGLEAEFQAWVKNLPPDDGPLLPQAPMAQPM